MSPVVILAIVAGAFLLMGRRSGTNLTTPESGTPNGAIPSRDGPRRAPPAYPTNATSDAIAKYNASVDTYNAWAIANGLQPISYYTVASDEQGTGGGSWYEQAVQTGGNLISQGTAAVTDFGSSVYNWATGSAKAVAGK